MFISVHLRSYFTIKKFILQLYDNMLKNIIYMLYYIKN